MAPKDSSSPIVKISIDASAPTGPLELWRHSLGHGGINSLPLPAHVMAGVRRLRPRLIRIFIQEFFRIYEGGGRFHWDRLDPYMAALAATGAKVMAAITIKPAALYPQINQAQWRPVNVEEWQDVIGRMVQRYSVERPIITHWEIGNETDIGESGGCPYLITDPADYGEYYSMTIRPILKASPEARVGGPAVASMSSPLLAGFVDYCKSKGEQLDFISWHLYSDDPLAHADLVRRGHEMLEGYPGKRPEMAVTEWNRGLPGCVEDQAFESKRAASTAATIIEMLDAGLDWSFYYHIWDQMCFHDDFAPIFSPPGLAGMTRHWNEVPHLLGLFGVEGKVRPQFFVYDMLTRFGAERLAVECEPGLRALAGRSRGRVEVLAVNCCEAEPVDRVATLRWRGLKPGLKRLTVRRIDDDRRWDTDRLELLPSEQRPVSTASEFECQVLLPAGTAAEVSLEEGGGA